MVSGRPDSGWDYTDINTFGNAELPQVEITDNGRQRYAYANLNIHHYAIASEKPNGTFTNLTVPGSFPDWGYVANSLTLMEDGSPLIVYTVSNQKSKIYCSWFKSGTTPITFAVGDAVCNTTRANWCDSVLDAQVVGSTLFVNFSLPTGESETWWTTVPEPSSIMALLAGVAGAGALGWRRRR